MSPVPTQLGSVTLPPALNNKSAVTAAVCSDYVEAAAHNSVRRQSYLGEPRNEECVWGRRDMTSVHASCSQHTDLELWMYAAAQVLLKILP